jgi:DNA-binding CsgD family transcriptional regulator
VSDPDPAAVPTLVGRSSEQAAVDDLLAAARQGLSGVLVLAGEAGVGKTALLEQAVRAANAFEVAAVAGVESEAGLGHAALHRLLLPYVDRVDELPEPQRDALAVAFGLAGGDRPDPFLVGLAALTLLSQVAAVRPVLCVVDDAQWIDAESLAVLAFVGRRLLADGVVLLFGVRGEATALPLDGLVVHRVEALDEASAVELLRHRTDGFVDVRVAQRLAGETLGNPLALVELADQLSPGQLSGAELLPHPLPLGAEPAARFLDQVRALPDGGQALVLVAAADWSGDPALVAAAASDLGLPEDAGSIVTASGLLQLTPRIRFRHPMVRSAVLAGAEPDELQRAHAALATVIDRSADPTGRAWHLAAGTAAPDAAVAEEIEEAARRTIQRGGYATAAALLDRAGRLSPEPADRGLRLLSASEAHLAAGNSQQAGSLLTEAERYLDDEWLKAQALRIDGAVRLADGQIPGTPTILVQAAVALAPFDLRGARDTLLEATSAAMYGGLDTRLEAMAEVAVATTAVALPDDVDATSGDLLLDGLAALFRDGHEAAVPALQEAVAAALADPTGGRELLRWLGFGCWAAGAIGDNQSVLTTATRLVELSRASGALGELTRGLYFLGIGQVVAGDLVAATTHFAESRDLMASRGINTSPGQVVASAWRGDEAATREAAAVVAQRTKALGQAGVGMYTDHALAVLELGLGQYEAALAAARRVDAEDSFFLSTVALPDLVEAAVRTGDPALAADVAARCRRRADACGTPLALGLAARADALVAGHDDAEALFQEAIAQLDGVAAGHLARAQLLYGEWLRRRHRRLDGREQLRLAHERFLDLGAAAFARRARYELEATGERAKRRTVEATTELTPQEAKVAELAAERATNGEIAAQLFISPSTVDYHLRKVFRKLGISSRRDLARVLG